MEPLDTRFCETVLKSPARGGWTYMVWPAAARAFGTRGRVKVRGTMDGAPFQSAFMPLGEGRHKLPVTAATLRRIGKGPGDTITVELFERL